MINFMNDYNSPGHPAVLKAIADAAGCKYPGYGTDDVSEAARKKIINIIGGRAGADVHFLAGGTQTNITATGAFLRPHEAVIAADTAHIQVHETGAIEAAGHRILLAPRTDGPADRNTGKLAAGSVRSVYRMHTDEHMVKPRLVYISQSTELGGVYTLSELKALREVCDDCGLLLYMDGARLGAALVSRANDASLADIADLCDAFYIGGTKNGLLFGEALVIMNDGLKEDFRYMQKQRGGLLAKGFLLGLQFGAIFDGDLFFSIARHADDMAGRLRSGLTCIGCRFRVESATNQLFPVLRRETVDKLKNGFLFEPWGDVDDEYAAIRLVTSWNTTEEEVEAMIEACRDSIR